MLIVVTLKADYYYECGYFRHLVLLWVVLYSFKSEICWWLTIFYVKNHYVNITLVEYLYNKVVYFHYTVMFIGLIDLMITYWINFWTSRHITHATHFYLDIIVLTRPIILYFDRCQGCYLGFNHQGYILSINKGHKWIPWPFLDVKT